MPETNAISTSGLGALYPEYPAGQLHQTMVLGTYDSGFRIPRPHLGIGGVENVPKPLAAQTTARTKQRAEPVTPSLPWSQSLNTRALNPGRLPIGVHTSSGNPSPAHLQWALSSFLAVNSDYWNQSLGGLPLCVLDDNEEIICRVSSAKKDRAATPKPDDAVIQLLDGQPHAYSRRLRTTMPNIYQIDPFYSAAAQAAQLIFPSQTNEPTETYYAIMIRHEAALNESIRKWNNPPGLTESAATMRTERSEAGRHLTDGVLCLAYACQSATR
jgi:hypothetical protein